MDLDVEREWVHLTAIDYIYEGEVIKGTSIPYGRGMLVQDGCVFEGWFNQCTRLIFGRKYSKEDGGIIYEGAFDQDEQYTSGTEIAVKKGQIFAGTFVDEALEGYGLLKKIGGNTYIGNFQNQKLHGYGVLNYGVNNQNCYKGMFHQGQMQGYGRSWQDGTYYEGQLKEDMCHGFGTVLTETNDLYIGSFKNSCCHGFNILKSKNKYYHAFFYKSKLYYTVPFQNFERYQQKCLRLAVCSYTFYWRIMRFMFVFNFKK
ncbi:hypothetical protein FGO68_gene3793 [Halteria grandinella]|uniref:MORN repeat protein n=1 Tax=Halteria grandinella TaxID=5974 RepID=A0A8J8N9M0_HALGN|nr:hypothetical protein FGO68_gene3793 [Halteria grandinella]